MPIFAVPKEDLGTFCLVTHQSYGQYSLNSMTPAHECAFPMDNMTHLGYQLLRAHQDKPPGQQLVLWKSDVVEAYRLLPMYPYWQIKQVNTIDSLCYIDHCNAFGGRQSGDLFIAFMSLVLWIAENCEGVKNLNGYVDDCFGVEQADEMERYDPYGIEMPASQLRLLRLWDQLQIPYKPKKQIHGKCLTIIGIEVDTNELTLTLLEDKHHQLIQEMDRFIIQKGKWPKRLPLRNYQALGGWINWALNVYLLLQPSLSNLYAKLRGLIRLDDQVKMTKAISQDLSWARCSGRNGNYW